MNESVMVVDDDRLVLYAIAQGLLQAGFDVYQADRAEEALHLCAQWQLDLALVDVRLPGMSGLELARRLTQLRVPVLFLSAYSDDSTVAEGIAGGALGYLVKPLDTTQIVPAVRTAIARGKDFAEREQNENKLVRALGCTRSVSVAVGLIMAHFALQESDAFEALRAAARSERRKLYELAGELIASRSFARIEEWVVKNER